MVSINTNIAALTAQRNLQANAASSQSSIAKLSSGSRVPTAKDDAAALAIGSRLNSEVVALQQASLNAGQASSLLQIADGAMGQVSDILARMQSLAVQSNSGQLSSTERTILNSEFTSLRSEVDRIAADTKFNGVSLLTGSTTTVSNINDLVADSGTGAAGNLLGEGFEAINFNDDYGNGAIKIEFEQASNTFNVTNLENGDVESVQISGTAIAAGQTQTVSFSQIGVELVLNEEFDKTADIAATGTATANMQATDIDVTVSNANGGSIVLGSGTNEITNVTGSDISVSDLDGISISFDPNDADVATLSGGPVVVGGRNYTISSNGGNVDFSTTGAEVVTFSDGQGNSFDVTFDIGTGSTDTDGVFTTTLTAARTPAVENSSINITAVNIDETDATTPFNFGDLDDATLAFSSVGAASQVDVTVGGVAFQATGVNLTTTGTKSVTLAAQDGTTNSFTVEFNVTAAFATNDTLEIELAQLGQVAGAESVSGSTTAFDFQIGTGIVASQDQLAVTLTAVDTSSLGINSSTIDTVTNATNSITALETAVTSLNTARANVGASQSRLDFAASNLAVAIENNTAARSALLDADVAAEITEFTSTQVLIQAGVSILAQANQQPGVLVQLLQ